MHYFRKIIGSRLYLSPMNTGDAEIYTIWLNDENVAANIGQYSKIVSLVTEQKYLDNAASGGQNYAIVLLDGDRLIGNISLFDENAVNRTATLGLFIGDEENRNKGYGAEAIRLLLSYGFKTLNLLNVMLTVNSDNLRAIACYKKVGFRDIGRRRNAVYKEGRYVDLNYMDILNTEFLKTNYEEDNGICYERLSTP